MFESEIDRRLRRLFKARQDVRPSHKGELEAELCEALRKRAPERARRSGMAMTKSVMFRRAMVLVGAAAILGVGACVAPADVDVDVGRSVDIQYEMVDGAPEPRAVVDLVKGQEGEPSAPEDVSVRVMRKGSSVAVHLDVWGSDLGDEAIADRIRKAFPALAGATIAEERLHGKVRGTVGTKIGHDLFDLDVVKQGDVEEVKKQIMAKLAAEGVDGAVDVQVENDGSKQKVMIRVEKQ